MGVGLEYGVFSCGSAPAAMAEALLAARGGTLDQIGGAVLFLVHALLRF